MEAILNVIMPQHLQCLSCSHELESTHDKWLCPSCMEDLAYIQEGTCRCCGKPLKHFERYVHYGYRCKACQEHPRAFHRHVSMTRYEGLSQKMLLQLKDRGKTYHVPFFAQGMAACVKQHYSDQQIDYIVPVPIHFTRRLLRGYNQSAMLAQHMGKVLGLRVYPDALKRIKRTKKLKKLNKDSRKQALSSAIMVNKTYASVLKDKRVLLVDDIYTTGATMNACAKALLRCGCDLVYGVTAAMGVNDKEEQHDGQ